MPYIGRGIETLSDRVVLDSLTASATASYTLQLNSVNFVPSSASSLTVSLNGVIQKPDSSYTVSGSTLTFSSALTSSDSIDFIIAERGITLQTPSAGSVNTDQLASNAVTAAKINDGEITNAKINSSAAIATTKLGTGAVLQVVQDIEQGVITYSTTYADALSLSITPSSTSSKILLNWHCTLGRGADDFGAISLFKDGTIVSGAIGTSGTSNRPNASNVVSNAGNLSGTIYHQSIVSNCFLDTPSSTSELTYAIKIKATYGSNIYLNRAENTNDQGHNVRTMSSLTAMEIAG